MIKLTIIVTPEINNTTFGNGIVVELDSFTLDKTDFIIKEFNKSLDYLYYYPRSLGIERNRFFKDRSKFFNQLIGVLSLGYINTSLLGAEGFNQVLKYKSFSVDINWGIDDSVVLFPVELPHNS